MPEAEVSFACQTYSWQMSGRWAGRLDEIAASVSSAGFAGIESEVIMAGGYETPDSLGSLLSDHDLRLAALTLVLDWCGPDETDAEREEADRVIDVVSTFEGTKLALVQMPRPGKSDRGVAQDNLLACLAAVTRRAGDRGVPVTFHPNSPPDSIVRSRADYDRVLPNLPSGLGWTPDTGHLHMGGMDPVEIIREYRDLVDHIHLKDADNEGRWVQNGAGVIDMRAAVRLLAESGFAGWVVVEDESKFAAAHPTLAARDSARYVREHLAPLVQR